MTKRLPVGVDDFKELATENYIFVDHTAMIRDFVDSSDKVSMILRPRRWGKSLTVSMLNYFLSNQTKEPERTFEKLKISENAEFYNAHIGKYPTLFISLKDIKKKDMDSFVSAVSLLIRDLYSTHSYLRRSGKLEKEKIERFDEFYLKKCCVKEDLAASVKFLMGLLYEEFGKKVYVFMDEYDTTINVAYQGTEFDPIISFLKELFGKTFKGNEYLAKGLMTGILRVSRNHMLSDLNNLEVYTSLDKKYSQYYGFLEEEVDNLFKMAGLEINFEEIKNWYNGYYSFDRIVYNPWSIISCLSHEGELRPYWVSTPSDDLIKQSFINANDLIKKHLGQLLLGQKIEAEIAQTTRLEDVTEYEDENDLWTLLFYAGYLKAEVKSRNGINYICALSIPNEEVKCTYRTIFSEWLRSSIGESSNYSSLLKNLASGNVKDFVVNINKFITQTVSFRDFTDENSYHCFTLGLLSGLMQTHSLHSNKEHGLGFPDVAIVPNDKHNSLGIILEFKHVKMNDGANRKVANKELTAVQRLEKLKKDSKEGLEQINLREYRRIFENPANNHVKVFMAVGVSFLGKSVAASFKYFDAEFTLPFKSGFAGPDGEYEEIDHKKKVDLAGPANTTTIQGTFFHSFSETESYLDDEISDEKMAHKDKKSRN